MLNVANSHGLDLAEVNEDLYAVKMGNDNSSLICTYGRIKIWFGRKASKELIRDILLGISKVDSCIEFEFETICGFDTIQHYENVGFKLLSYAKYAPSGIYPPPIAKTPNLYKAIFNVPFSREEALHRLVDFLMERLHSKNINSNLHWSGNDTKIRMLYNEFKEFERWKVEEIHLKSQLKK
ncbi:MAG: hypothetical protein SVY15_00800 [Halobacteriota archaeon]|nr:hypothetical protein [Halobacteriota archaeon]